MKKSKDNTIHLKSNDIESSLETMKYPSMYNDNKIRTNLKKAFNFNKIIDEKKRKIKNMVKNTLGKANLLYSNRKPSPLLRLEKGLTQYFSDLNGDFIRNFPNLRRKLIYEKEKQKQKLENRIDAGTLLYLYLKNNDKISSIKKNVLIKSQHFSIKTGIDIVQEEFTKLKNEEKHKRDSVYSIISPQKKIVNKPKIKSQSPKNNFNILNTNKNISNNKTSLNFFSHSRSRNINKNDLFKLTSYNSNDNFKTPKKRIFPKINLNTIDSLNKKTISESNKSKITNTNTISSSSRRINFYLLSPSQKNKIIQEIKLKKNLKTTINERVNLLQSSNEKCNNQLFKLIDNSKLPDKNNLESIKTIDMQEILDYKKSEEKKELEFDSAKKNFSAANKDYYSMDKDKAELLSLSDKVCKLPDDVALYLVDRIAKKYEKQSINIMDEISAQYSPLLEIIKKKQKEEIRQRLKINHNKMIRLNATLEIEKEEMNKLHEMIESKKEQDL